LPSVSRPTWTANGKKKIRNDLRIFCFAFPEGAPWRATATGRTMGNDDRSPCGALTRKDRERLETIGNGWSRNERGTNDADADRRANNVMKARAS
jgi:hypothetical protein